MKKSTFIHAGMALSVGALLAVAAPLAASAHVTVDPGQASAGSYATLTFKVPNESETAGTVKLAVTLPTDTPFTAVSYQPVPGWSTEVVTQKLDKPVKISGATVTEAPSSVVWTAEPGTQITAGQFQRFAISVGPVPSVGHLALAAVQTYSDGTVVNWDQKAAADGTEPEHPAPTLYINDAPPSGAHEAASAGSVNATTGPVNAAAGNAAGAATEASHSAADATAMGLGIGGLALGAIALVVAALALTRRRQTPKGNQS
ncbi:MAG: YcnI family protein [Microbacteriaceae bacterium]